MEYIFKDGRDARQRLKDKLLNINFSRPSANKAFLGTFLILLAAIPLTVFVAMQKQSIRNQAATDTTSNQRLEKPIPPRGYIVEFKTSPISSDLKSLSSENKETVRNTFNLRKAQILSEHESARKDILAKLGKTAFDFSKDIKGDKKVKIIGEFTNAFNGIALDIDDNQVNKLKTSSFVKAVYPNNSVKVNLNESVPLIGADKVWQLKDSNGVNLTGKGVNIAILDTGIDYTHPDLGNTIIDERPFTKITSSPFTTYSDSDQSISYNQNRMAYASGDDVISIYSFATGQTLRLNLGTTGLSYPRVYSLRLSGDNIFYMSTAYDGDGLYMKNIVNGRLTKISDMGILDDHYVTAGRYGVSNGKLIYERQTGTKDISGNTLFNIYSYDIANNTETKLLDDSTCLRYPRVDGDNFAYTEGSSPICYEKAIIYNTVTNQKKEINPVAIGPINDFKGDLILYRSCCVANVYYLYNINTGESKELSYSVPSFPSSFSGQSNWTITFGYNLQKGLIGDGVVFFKKDERTNKVIAYDLETNRYAQINLKIPAGVIDGEGKKICFTSHFDFQIYCHDYDKNYGYPLPTQMYNQKVIGGYNFIDLNTDGLDDHGHGTHVAAIAAGNGVLKGVAPDANLIAYKVLNSYGSGYLSTIISAVDTAIQTRFDTDSANDIDVINLSLGAYCGSTGDQYSDYCGPNDPLSTAVDNAAGNGIVVAVAAGNGGRYGDLISSPGTASKAITAGAVDKLKKIAEFSSKGPVIWRGVDLKKPDVVAPGVSICSAELFGLVYPDNRCLDDKHISLNGTSMATPHVAGLAALVIQAHPDWTVEQIKQAIKDSAQNIGYDYNTAGAGMIDGAKLFNIVPPEPKKLTLTPIKDAYVSQSNANTNFGTGSTLRVDNTPKQISYIGFDLRTLKDKKIISAKLVLKVGQVKSNVISQNFNLKHVIQADWQEKKVTYTKRLPLASGSLNTFKGKKTGEMIEIDVKEVVNLYKGTKESFAITTSGKDVLIVRSKESASNKPKLIVEYE